MQSIWGNWETAPLMFNSGTRWRWVVISTFKPLHPHWTCTQYSLNRRLGELQESVCLLWRREHLLRVPGIEEFLSCTACSLVTILIMWLMKWKECERKSLRPNLRCCSGNLPRGSEEACNKQKCNTYARSRNHCCSGKALIVKYYECVSL
jgi:hypothetical protein